MGLLTCVLPDSDKLEHEPEPGYDQADERERACKDHPRAEIQRVPGPVQPVCGNIDTWIIQET